MQQEKPDRFVRLKEVRNITGRGTTSIYMDMNAKPPRFPRNVRIGRRAVAWKLSSILEWMEKQEQESRGENE